MTILSNQTITATQSLYTFIRLMHLSFSKYSFWCSFTVVYILFETNLKGNNISQKKLTCCWPPSAETTFGMNTCSKNAVQNYIQRWIKWTLTATTSEPLHRHSIYHRKKLLTMAANFLAWHASCATSSTFCCLLRLIKECNIRRLDASSSSCSHRWAWWNAWGWAMAVTEVTLIQELQQFLCSRSSRDLRSCKM